MFITQSHYQNVYQDALIMISQIYRLFLQFIEIKQLIFPPLNPQIDTLELEPEVNVLAFLSLILLDLSQLMTVSHALMTINS